MPSLACFLRSRPSGRQAQSLYWFHSCRLAAQIIDFLNSIRQHNVVRLRKERRAADKEAEAAASGLLDAAVHAVEAAAALQGSCAEGSGGSNLGDALNQPADRRVRRQGEDSLVHGTCGSGGGREARPSRRPHVSLEYEAAGRHKGQEQQQQAGRQQAQDCAVLDVAVKSDGWPEPSASELLSLEWLRTAPDDVARNYLMNINGAQGAMMLGAT
jgi:hypothetical protein